jgi:hypothetical protein
MAELPDDHAPFSSSSELGEHSVDFVSGEAHHEKALSRVPDHVDQHLAREPNRDSGRPRSVTESSFVL